VHTFCIERFKSSGAAGVLHRLEQVIRSRLSKCVTLFFLIKIPHGSFPVDLEKNSIEQL
jgi:hypothetical protein